MRLIEDSTDDDDDGGVDGDGIANTDADADVGKTVHDHGMHLPSVPRWTGMCHFFWLSFPLLLNVSVFITGSSRPSPSPRGSVRESIL